MADTHDSDHEFKGTWRWPTAFEAWVEDLLDGVDGPVANICAGLSPLGDVRVDMKSPLELIENLQEESSTTLQDTREYLTDLVIGSPPIDVIGSLYTAENPTDHPASKYIQTANTVRADILNDALPFADNSFAFVLCDPPWLNLGVQARSTLFDELVRIAAPGATLLFNGYWTPTADGPVTLDRVVPRQDTERWSVGTPNVSWASIYTVHDSVHTARYISETLTRREFTPAPQTIDESIRAHRYYELTQKAGVDSSDFELDIVDPATTERDCPECGHTELHPLPKTELNVDTDAQMYECGNCHFRPLESETRTEADQATLLAGGNPSASAV